MCAHHVIKPRLDPSHDKELDPPKRNGLGRPKRHPLATLRNCSGGQFGTMFREAPPEKWLKHAPSRRIPQEAHASSRKKIRDAVVIFILVLFFMNADPEHKSPVKKAVEHADVNEDGRNEAQQHRLATSKTSLPAPALSFAQLCAVYDPKTDKKRDNTVFIPQKALP